MAKSKQQSRHRPVLPRYADGMRAFQSGDYHFAERIFAQMTAAGPQPAATWYALGYCQHENRRFSDAVHSFRQAIALEPDNVAAWNSLGNALRQLNHNDDAIAAFEKVLTLEPEHPNALTVLGTMLVEIEQWDRGLELMLRAFQVQPDSETLAFAIACNFAKLKDLEAARDYFERAIDIRQDFFQAYNNLSGVLIKMGDHDGSLRCLNRSLRLAPHPISASNLIMQQHYHPSYTAHDHWLEARIWNRMYGLKPPVLPNGHSNDPTPNRRLRIGYVSADLRVHPVGFFMRGVFRHHDRTQFEVFTYIQNRSRDWLTEELLGHSDHWVEVADLSDEQLSQRIVDDGIDILVDLAAHTAGNRLTTFARRPAPVQITAGGHFDTTGMDTMDYLITDGLQSPPGVERYFSERLIRLPNDYICYQPPDYASEVSPLPALSKGHITFGYFNNVVKLNDTVIATWAHLLSALPEARLELHYAGFESINLQDRILAAFAAGGVEAPRIGFFGGGSHVEFLKRYQRVDVALDAFPYSGGLSTCEALWMGVPVISLAGKILAGRHALTHLSNVGLGEFATPTCDAYIEKAIAVAQDPNALATLRAGLRERMTQSPICDTAAYTRDYERALRNTWAQWCAAR